jgi:predicted RNase H-like HicB family nuclease
MTRYPVLIEEGTEYTAYGVAVPDLPGCFSAGASRLSFMWLL